MGGSWWGRREKLTSPAGEYETSGGQRKKVAGDVSKIDRIIGLTAEEKAPLRNYRFMSSRLAGTRQIRSSIRHVVFSSRIFYGVPVFITFTPSERHSGLALHLYRGRRADPVFAAEKEDVRKCLGAKHPSLCPGGGLDGGEDLVAVDLPEYDVRRGITARDPLCCVRAFQVMTRVVLPSLYGFRMCANCPHCAATGSPCMDAFGSNATPMGGAAGRADAMVGAVEAQKAEGVLHVHAFLYPSACGTTRRRAVVAPTEAHSFLLSWVRVCAGAFAPACARMRAGMCVHVPRLCGPFG